MRLFSYLSLTLAAGCAGAPQLPNANLRAPAFPAIGFFQGRTQGEGQLRTVLKAPMSVTVQSIGRVAGDGSLILTQRIQEGAKRERTREWRMREIAPGRYSGALTDASGPVSGEASGNRLRFSYRMKGGLDVEQWLTLAPDGRSADNVLVVRKFGITVATLRERIRKLS
jgi:hypothetical protein